MTDIGIDLSDLGRLQTLLAGASNKATSDMPGILDDVADAVVADAQSRAPRDTGALAESIGVLERRGNAQRRDRIIGSRLRQAFFQELGTSEHPPQPSIVPATEAGTDKLLEQLGELGDIW